MLEYHTGELDVQIRAGLPPRTSRVNKSIRPTLPSIAQTFLQEQRMIILGSTDNAGRVWASVLTGQPGFLQAPDEQTVEIDAIPLSADPIAGQLHPGASIGTITVDFATRRRMRVNGQIARVGEKIILHTEQVYSNCPKYIQTRALTEDTVSRDIAHHQHAMPSPDLTPTSDTAQAESSTALDGAQQAWIERADTFFIASSHHAGGADVSHRGGPPGFVQVESPTRLLLPDYSGNRMYQTLGNIQEEPRVGLLFLDFERGNTLQLSGEAQIIWEKERLTDFVGAERLIEFTINRVIQIRNAIPLHWQFVEYSPALPRARA